MAKAAKIKKQHARASLLTKLLVLLLLAGIGWQLFSLQGQVRAAQAEKAARSQQAIRVCRARAIDRCPATRVAFRSPACASTGPFYFHAASGSTAAENHRKEKQNTVWSLRLGAL